MSQELATVKPNCLLPQTFDQAERYAEKIAVSSLCPNAFKNKAGDVLIAIQMGAEVGLSPMQAIQNIAVINGRPSVWGDAAIGIVRSHKHCQAVREWTEGKISDESLTAYCGVTRKGQPEEIRTFSIAQAKKAGLWGKTGPWSQYPERMLQMRARGFAIRDTFPDALRGLHIAEEAQDIPNVTYTVVAENNTPQKEKAPLSLSNSVDNDELEKHIHVIKNCNDMEILKTAYSDAMIFAKGDKEALNKIANAKNEQKELIKNNKIPKEEPNDHKEWISEFEDIKQ